MQNQLRKIYYRFDITVIVIPMLLVSLAMADYGSGFSGYFLIDNRAASLEAGLSNSFPIDNRGIYIEATQFNRIPAVIPQSPARTTLPLKFPGEILDGGTAPIDLGPLSVSARIANPSATPVYVKLKVKEYIDPSGKRHTKLLNGSYSENTYWEMIEPVSTRDLSVYVNPPSNDIGDWQVLLDLYQRKGITSFSEEKITSATLQFTVINPDLPTVQSPGQFMDKLGNILMPPSQISQKDTIWSVLYENINALGDILGIEGSVGSAYTDYYDGLSDLLENIRSSAILKVNPKNMGSDTEYNITWYESISAPYSFGMDRAVLFASISDGISSSDLIDSGGASVLESEGQIRGLLWLIDGIDKRIWQTTSRNRCSWIPRDLSFRVHTNSIKGKKVQFSLQLQIGPFANYNLNYGTLDKAPWIYDYSGWFNQPEDMYWYTIAATDPVTIIDESHHLTINKVLDYLLISDSGTLYLPYHAISQEDVSITWAETVNPPIIPAGYNVASSIRTFDTTPVIASLDKPATITLPYTYAGTDTDRLGIFQWDASASDWSPLITEVDTTKNTASAKIFSSGIYAVLWSSTTLEAMPEIILQYPASNEIVQDISPEFKWNDPIGNGWLYQIQLAEDIDFEDIIADEISSQNSLVFASGFMKNTYFWRARRLDQVGTVSKWTNPSMFTITSDTTAPLVSDLTPEPNERILNENLLIKAHVIDEQTEIDPNSIKMILDGNEIECVYDYVEGKIIYIPLNGTLSVGDHEVQLFVSDIDGNEASIAWNFVTTCNLLVETSLIDAGATTPDLGSHVIDTKDTWIEYTPQHGYQFLKWVLLPEDSGILLEAHSPGTTLCLMTDAVLTAYCFKVDLTEDRYVNMEDLSKFSNNWMRNDCSSPNWCEGTDYDLSGVVDLMDLVVFMENWLY